MIAGRSLAARFADGPRRCALLLALALSSAPSFAAQAETAESLGLEIAMEADRRDSGWRDQRASLRMTLGNRRGQQSTRELRVRTLEVEGDGDRSIVVFDSPRDVNGTALLTYTHALEPDDQWLYLPALKRVKRISSATRSGPFVGSEFAYEDFTSQEVEKYSYRWLRDEMLARYHTRVIERRPAYEHSGYSRQIVWLDEATLQARRVEYHDRKDALLKTLSLSDYRQYDGRFWRAHRMGMVNHQTGKTTVLEWGDYRLATGLTERDFERDKLRRQR